MTLTNGQRSSIVRRHNIRKETPDQISAALGIDVRSIEDFLKTRIGYPGKIINNNGYKPTKKPSLASVKFIEAKND